MADQVRKSIMKQWGKRKEQIERVVVDTVGMHGDLQGDLQGIAGKSLQEIEGLDLIALAVPVTGKSKADGNGG